MTDDEARSILGVDQSATHEDIHEAYRRLVQIFHPDRFDNGRDEVRAEAERRMKQLTEAYALLAQPASTPFSVPASSSPKTEGLTLRILDSGLVHEVTTPYPAQRTFENLVEAMAGVGRVEGADISSLTATGSARLGLVRYGIDIEVEPTSAGSVIRFVFRHTWTTRGTPTATLARGFQAIIGRVAARFDAQ
jgi:hypothetical protein